MTLPSVSNLGDLLEELIILAQNHENAPDWALGLKLGEECGEVQSVLLHANGFIQHKSFDEDVMHECADVFNVITAILAKHYEDMSVEELSYRFFQAVDKKGQKYRKLLEDGLNQ